MTTTIIIITILLILILLSICGYGMYSMFFLLKKYETAILHFRDQFENACKKMNNLRLSEAFSSDDEIGWTFDVIDATITELDEVLNTPIDTIYDTKNKEDQEEEERRLLHSGDRKSRRTVPK